MVLKSYTLKETFKRKNNPSRKRIRSQSDNFIRDATGAIIGLALFSTIAGSLSRL